MAEESKLEAWREGFRRIPSSGEHYACKECGDVFSNVAGNSEWSKAILFGNHLKEHATKEYVRQGRIS